MNSTDFGPIVSPIGAGSGLSRHYAHGGAARKPHHLTIVIAQPQPHPLMGALMQALLLRHAAHLRALHAGQRLR